MDNGSNFLSEFDHLLGIPPPTVEDSSVASNFRQDYVSPSFDLDFWSFCNDNVNTQSSFPATLDPMATLPGLQVDYHPSAGSQNIGLSQNNLAVFNSLSESHDVAPSKVVPAKPESSTTSSRPRFLPPKGPRKQHRTGFRQLPGANGVIKRGRPSKKEYKLAGVEVDMYALKGITLHGPAKSLDEVMGGEAIVKRSARGSQRPSRKSKSSVSAAAKSKLGPGPSTYTIQEEALSEQALIPNQSYKASQDMLFSSSAQGASSGSTNSYQLSQPNMDIQNLADLNFLSALQAFNDEISFQNNSGIHNAPSQPQPNFVSSQWEPNTLADGLGFQPLTDFQSSTAFQPSTGFQPSTSFQGFPDLELSTGYQSLSDLPPLSGLQQLQQQITQFPALNPSQGSLPAGVNPIDPNLNFSLTNHLDSDPASQSYANDAVGIDGNLLSTYPNSQYSAGSSYTYPPGFQNFQY